MSTPTEPNASNTPKRMGLAMFILAWLVLLAMLITFFDGWIDEQVNPNQQPLSEISSTGITEVILMPNRQHHYVTNGFINGHKVVFLLDTGATDVVIPSKLAASIGLVAGRKQLANTANGTVTVANTELDSVQIGGIKLYRIRASINPGMRDNMVLLGMSALREIEFAQRGDALILRQ
ncbi:TIGR02281 family clan AA aspartic protease [Oceanicoccus sp. KOV_DT_Chl]|uniref:retropepsin-like aspartic protease family protein n=1 Tax=Oceanicoccus sp. KOV_DT_Chl TaxID=1904639 RepID=UPI001F3E6A71|nr:TIGR02281 family clan AA aspartic protease [Oceanicoccus sp. KOV_DT_Chl]